MEKGVIKCEIYIINRNAIIPSKKYPSDAGYDIFSLAGEHIPPRGQNIIRTGVGLNYLTPGYVIQVWPKSGMDAGYSLHTGAGIIDSAYRGEILVLLKNMSDKWVEIGAGEAIAQLVFVPVMSPIIETVKLNSSSARDDDGGIKDVYIKRFR